MNIERNTLIQVINADIIDGYFIVPEGIEEIGWRAFWYCTSLTSITLPSSVKEIGNGAFAYCHKLNEVNCEDEELRDTVMFQTLIGRQIPLKLFKELSQLATKTQ